LKSQKLLTVQTSFQNSFETSVAPSRYPFLSSMPYTLGWGKGKKIVGKSVWKECYPVKDLWKPCRLVPSPTAPFLAFFFLRRPKHGQQSQVTIFGRLGSFGGS
jgi:hypothetical protein